MCSPVCGRCFFQVSAETCTHVAPMRTGVRVYAVHGVALHTGNSQRMSISCRRQGMYATTFGS